MGILHESVEELTVTAQDPTENDRVELKSPDIKASALSLTLTWKLEKKVTEEGRHGRHLLGKPCSLESLRVQSDCEETGSKLKLQWLSQKPQS